MKKTTAKRFHSAAREIAYIALSVSLITVCAWISLPIGEVPFTLQTFAVALVGAVLGVKRGAAAIAVYLLMGLVGIPVFAGFRAANALFDVAGGYIFGFLFLALIPALCNHLPLKRGRLRSGMLYLSMLAGLFVCYFFGTAWFILLTKSSVSAALAVCVLPFLVPDFIKLFLAATLSAQILSLRKIP